MEITHMEASEKPVQKMSQIDAGSEKALNGENHMDAYGSTSWLGSPENTPTP